MKRRQFNEMFNYCRYTLGWLYVRYDDLTALLSKYCDDDLYEVD